MPKPTAPKFKPPKSVSKYDPKANPPAVKGDHTPKSKTLFGVSDKMKAQLLAFSGIATGTGKSMMAYAQAMEKLSAMADADEAAMEQLKQAFKAGEFAHFYGGGYLPGKPVIAGVDYASVEELVGVSVGPLYSRLYAIHVFSEPEDLSPAISGYVVAKAKSHALGIWDQYRPEDAEFEVDIRQVRYNQKDDSPTHRLVKSGLYGVLIPADDEKGYPRLIEVDVT